jgi:spore maturation protein CgeB
MPPGPFALYGDGEELVDRVRRLRANPHERRQIGEACRDWVVSGHLYRHRAEKLLDILAGSVLMKANRPEVRGSRAVLTTTPFNEERARHG